MTYAPTGESLGGGPGERQPLGLELGVLSQRAAGRLPLQLSPLRLGDERALLICGRVRDTRSGHRAGLLWGEMQTPGHEVRQWNLLVGTAESGPTQ